MNRFVIGIVALVIAMAGAMPAAAAQLGIGLHYLRTLEEIEDAGGAAAIDPHQDDFALFGSITLPLELLRVEGNLEWVPDYLGLDEQLFQPAAYALLDIGPAYGGVGIGIGYLTGDDAGWATNPFYALRAGIEFGLGGLALDAFAAYRFQSSNFIDGAKNADLDALTLAAQIKFGS